jgi:hypothetical protein
MMLGMIVAAADHPNDQIGTSYDNIIQGLNNVPLRTLIGELYHRHILA